MSGTPLAVIAPGAEVTIPLPGQTAPIIGRVEAAAVYVDRIAYLIEYWDGKTRQTQWLPPALVTANDPRQLQTIGFTRAI